MAVYFIRAGAFGDVKIGSAKNPVARMKQLQTSLPVRLRLVRAFEGGLQEERAVQARYADLRKTGEWFRFDARMLADDVGLVEVETPAPKHGAWKVTSAGGRYRSALDDLLETIGGREFLARAIGSNPHNVNTYAPHAAHVGALVALARQAGADVALPDVMALHDLAQREAVETAAANAQAGTAKWVVQHLQHFVAKNGEAAIWWPLTDAEKAWLAQESPAPQPAPATA